MTWFARWLPIDKNCTDMGLCMTAMETLGARIDGLENSVDELTVDAVC